MAVRNPRTPGNVARMPRGAAPVTSAAALERSSVITDDDIIDAAATFRRDAPAPYRDLLDAVPRIDTSDLPVPAANAGAGA